MSQPIPSSMAVGRIAATVPVTDVDRAVEFYRTFLGLQVEFVNGQPVGFAIVRNGPAELHLTRVKHHRPAAHNVAHVLVDDAASLCEAMDAAGVRIVKGLRDADYGIRGFVFCDPDGNRIDVGQVLLSRSH